MNSHSASGLSHVTNRWLSSESCHIWLRHVTNEWVMSHMHQSRHGQRTIFRVITHMTESCPIWMSRVTYQWVMSHTHLCTRAESIMHVWDDLFKCQNDSFIRDTTHPYVTWLIYTWHDSFIRDMTPSYVTWLLHTWHNMSHINESCHAVFHCKLSR